MARCFRGRSQAVCLGAFFLICSAFLLAPGYTPVESATESQRAPILLYHRFADAPADSMTVGTAVFASQLKYLQEHRYAVITLRQLVAWRLGKAGPPPPNSVAITADDGHRSVYTEMFPFIKRYGIPVTLFIYPSAISNAPYAMTWAQLKELQETGLFEIQSHTYWHPNFRNEKKRLTPAEYEKFLKMQLTKSKEQLEKKLGIKVDMLAWPFGIFDQELARQASETGYVAAFTIKRHHVSSSDSVMALPRYLLTNKDEGRAFERLLSGR
jgi:peptidoglycan/xylan/chitin deacetylase (PgdA/CDA1 family)